MKALVLPLAVAGLLTACTTTTQFVDKLKHKYTHKHSHSQTHEHSHSHSHDPAHWDYDHPELWGDIEVNKLCSAGTSQSPINIDKVATPEQSSFNLVGNYTAQDFSVKNNGHTVVFNAKNPSDSKLSINGVTYELLQFHYHIPSEHTVMNAFYPLEIHFVHKNADGKLAVVGVLVDKGKKNKDFGKILTDLPKDSSKDGELKGFNVQSIMPADSPTYAYDGSLTTPPCSEQVQWLLKSKPIHASKGQLKVLSALYKGNNRPVQPQGDRVVELVK